MIVSLIAAMSKNRVIGKDNALPWHLPNDLKFFKDSTMGKPIVMGRKTYESIGRPLPGRPNIVVTRNPDFEAKGVTVVTDLETGIEVAAGLSDDDDNPEVCVIGGGDIYTQSLPFANKIYLTEVDTEIDGDTYFPEFDMDAWEVISKTPNSACSKNPHDYTFMVLVRAPT